MDRIRTAALISALIIGMSAIVPASSDEPRKIDDPDVYRIYEKVVDLLGDYPKPKPRTTVPVVEVTDSFTDDNCLPKPDTADEHAKFDPALNDFREKNKSKWKLDASGFQSSRIQLVPITAPVGLRVSVVGFNTDKTAAVVYGFFVCGSLCGHGMPITFVRTEVGWQVVHVGKTGCQMYS